MMTQKRSTTLVNQLDQGKFRIRMYSNRYSIALQYGVVLYRLVCINAGEA